MPGKLLAGYYPGEFIKNPAFIKTSRLLEAGIRHIINLMEASEQDGWGNDFDPYLEGMQTDAAARGLPKITLARFPILDGNIPTRPEMSAILDNIDKQIASERPVYVHCWGGRGRTGMVVGCYLIRHKLATPENALEELQRLRRAAEDAGKASPETPWQGAFVREWRPGE